MRLGRASSETARFRWGKLPAVDSSPAPPALLSALLGLLLFLDLAHLARDGQAEAGGERVVLYGAAVLRAPLEELAHSYEERYGTRIEARFGGSGAMLALLESGGDGDLFLPADDSYVELARSKHLSAEVLPLASLRAVIGVAPGNPLHISTLDDLSRPGLRLGIGDPRCAVGLVVRELLGEAGRWAPIASARTVEHPTVNQLGTDLALGALDAALIWDATARQYGLDLVAVPLFEAAPRRIEVALLRRAPHRQAALRFARFLTSTEAHAILARHGFQPLDAPPG